MAMRVPAPHCSSPAFGWRHRETRRQGDAWTVLEVADQPPQEIVVAVFRTASKGDAALLWVEFEASMSPEESLR